jgi:antitoxin (DNA-binding transcriptional repressor) of toxin-antitoxin stability system
MRNSYSELLKWIQAGEEIVITRRGKTIARLVPERAGDTKVDWSKSTAVRRDRSDEPVLSEDESARLIKEAGGRW